MPSFRSLVVLAALAARAPALAAPVVRDPFPSDPLFGDSDPLSDWARRDSLSPSPAPDVRSFPRAFRTGDQSWRVWPVQEGAASTDLETGVSRTASEVVVTFRAPGSEPGTLSVMVVPEGLRVTYRANGRGYEQTVGTPDDAIPGSARIEVGGAVARVIFSRRAH